MGKINSACFTLKNKHPVILQMFPIAFRSKKIEKPGPTICTKNILLNSMFQKSKRSGSSKKTRPNIKIMRMKYNLEFLMRRSGVFEKYIDKVLTHANYFFPIDPKYHPSNFDQNPSEFSQYFSQISTKRICRIQINSTKHTWTYRLEDRNLNANTVDHHALIHSHLESLPNTDAIIVAELLLKWSHQKNSKVSQKLPAPTLAQSINNLHQHAIVVQAREILAAELSNFDSQHEMVELMESEVMTIQNNAYVCMVEEISASSVYNNRLCYFKHNKLLQDLIGGLKVKLSGSLEGFQVLKHMTSKNWLSYLREMLQFRLGFTRNGTCMSPESLHLLDSKKKIIKTGVKLFKKIYRRDEKVFHKIYTVFVAN